MFKSGKMVGVMVKKEIHAPFALRESFDRMFERYCQPLTKGVVTRAFVPDTELNRTLLGEFENYLQQRAAHEGWEYEPGSFQVTYSDQISSLNREVRLCNPEGENVVFEQISEERGELFKRASSKRSREIRDKLDLLVFGSE